MSTPSRSTTEKMDMKKPLILERLLRAWEKKPDATLGTLIASAVMYQAEGGMSMSVLHFIEDEELIKSVERLVLMGPPNGTQQGSAE